MVALTFKKQGILYNENSGVFQMRGAMAHDISYQSRKIDWQKDSVLSTFSFITARNIQILRSLPIGSHWAVMETWGNITLLCSKPGYTDKTYVSLWKTGVWRLLQ